MGIKEKKQDAVASTHEKSKWMGDWEKDLWQNSASLEITDAYNDTIEFSLTVASGGNTGDVQGKAIVKGNIARFFSISESDSCGLSFELFGDTLIKVNHEKGFCNAGIAVQFAGDYYNKHFTNKSLSNKYRSKGQTLLTLGVFSNARQDSAFRQLTKEDYDLFVNTVQLTSDDDEDLDGFHAKVQSSTIRGLNTIMENIIMTDSSGRIWAAVIDDSRVLYYTNDAAYKTKLPKTIETWRSRFDEYPIWYK